MAPSQFKRLKASLREQGIIGPQKSKKQKRKSLQDTADGQDKRLQRSVALEGIRDQFNPFQYKTNARGPKFEATSLRTPASGVGHRLGRPGVTKAAGEEKRRQTLLGEMQRRNKVGGIRDRRFAEDDPTMTLEEKMLQRFAREKQTSHKKASIFDLEDERVEEPLTHMGRALDLDVNNKPIDDFDERDLSSDPDSDLLQSERQKFLAARQASLEAVEQPNSENNGSSERPKTRQEVMKEVIAKSKLHKYERQAQKDTDDDLRLEIDKELPHLQALLSRDKAAGGAPQSGLVYPKIAGYDKTLFDQAYDLRVRQLAQDKRAQPSEPTKTEEEVAELEAQRLKELEEKRVRRMAGQEETDSEDEEAEPEDKDANEPADKSRGLTSVLDPAEGGQEFGLGRGVDVRQTAPRFDDEDDFMIDDDLVASGSEIEEDEDNNGLEYEDDDDGSVIAADDDDGFTHGLLTAPEEQSGVFADRDESGLGEIERASDLPYTFPCPQSHAELLELLTTISLAKTTQVIQRIRALHHPGLAAENKKKLATFARVLVQHIVYIGNEQAVSAESSGALENVMRHVHSLAKSFPVEVSQEFRAQLGEMGETRPLNLSTGDLALLTAIRLYPTSDHFHLVVTPAMLTMTRYLGQKIPRSLSDYAVGTYVSLLAVEYQHLSKRYVPEVLNFQLNTLCSLAPQKLPMGERVSPTHDTIASDRISGARAVPVRRLSFEDCRDHSQQDEGSALSTKVALENAAVSVLTAAADLWSSKSAFTESFEPVVRVLEHWSSEPCRAHLPPALQEAIAHATTKLQRMLSAARLTRRPLELHHHRPVAIKTFVPKFEDTFDPHKHYDPDRDRAQLAKLKAEHRRERKGAVRELRKDASFMARENLRQKKERDTAYEKKFKRLVAEIQGEEGHEANVYEREKQARKRAKRR